MGCPTRPYSPAVRQAEALDRPLRNAAREVRNTRLYLATLSTLYVLEENELQEVDVDLEHPVGFYRLDSGDGVLWSFGPKDLLRFDGQTWERVPFQENAA